MPNNTTGFAECLTRIMKNRGLSVGELTEILGLKSKTTIARILQNNAGERSILNFRNLLVNSRELALTAEEVQKLDDSVSYQKKETAHSFIFSELWALLYHREVPRGEVRLLGDEPYATLSEFGRALKRTEVECRIVNCGFHSFVGAAEQFLESHRDAPLSMHQYFYNAGDYPRKLVQMVGRIVPVLSYDNYMAYTITQDSPDGCFDLNVIALRCGTGEEYEILFCNERTAILTRGEGLYRKWEAFLADFRSVPIKSVKDPGTYNYIGFMDHYRKLEDKNDVYKFRLDLCINCIPADILEAAFVEGCEQNGISAPKETVSTLVGIQRKRFRNAHSKQHSTRLVVSESAMRKFVETGRQSDHAHTMRPFTPAERLRILNECLAHINPSSETGFHLHLLTPEDEERICSNEHPVEMVCYAGSCVQLTPALTDYNFGKGHSEIFISQDMFQSLFIEFFMNDLVQYHTQPEVRTVEFLREMVGRLEGK